MKLSDTTAVLRAANPVEGDTVAGLSLAGGEEELLSALVGDAELGAATAHRRRRARHYRRYGFVLVAACALAAAILIFGSGGSGPTPQPAFAAAAIAVAEANPRLLVTAPGWSIKHAYGFEVDGGSTIFGDGAHHLTFDWYPARFYRGYLREREGRGAVVHSTVLGHRATTVRYPTPANEPGVNYETLISPWGKLAISVRGSVAGKREYEAILNSLRRVDVGTWLNAMPPEVVKPDALDATIEQMLRGVPIPPNFDASTLPNGSLVTDRYRLGTAVTGAVTCGWLEDWVTAARNHDVAGAREAARGLGSARNWPVLLAMVREKGWKGDRLPTHGNGWASEILKVAREIGEGRLSQGSGIYMETADGRLLIEEGPGWSIHFGCKSHYRRERKMPKNAGELDRFDPVVTLTVR